jgi:elongation factor P
LQFLYADGDQYNFMDPETYDQQTMSGDLLGSATSYIKENDTVDFLMHNDEVVDVDLPAAVVLKIVKSDPGVRGDTATGAVKPATLETGLTVNVPLFVNEGDSIKVDTRSGKYLERV